MWRGLRAAPVPSKSIAPGGDGRTITAKYNIAGRCDARTGLRSFFACRVEELTPTELTLSVPVTGNIGDPVLVQVDRLGAVQGFISKQIRIGFVMSITATETERAKLAKKIDWFLKNRDRKVVNKRRHDRFTPANPHSTLILGDGRTLRCFVVDMSASGAAVSANVAVEAGTPLAVGKIVGRVVRHLPSGFAVQFIQAVDIAMLEDLLIKPSV
jgi:PilZ domain